MTNERADDDPREPDEAPVEWPPGWDLMWNGQPMPDWVALVREIRGSD